MSQRGQRLGKTARHVGEAADFRVRRGFGGRENDLHGRQDVNEM